jgi:hypothetical protein
LSLLDEMAEGAQAPGTDTSAHALLAPSSASRWMRCAGSVAACKDIPDEATEESAEGDAFHALVATCLDIGLEPEDFEGKTWTIDGHPIEIDEEMIEWAREGLDRLREIINDTAVVEKHVSLDGWLPDGQFGTTDVGWHADDTIFIWDWKYGFIPVSPIENEQLMLYALGLWNALGRPKLVVKFRLIIEQPRAIGGGGEWEVSLEDLLAFGERARVAGKNALAKRAPRTAGPSQCRFCPVQLKCKEYTAFNMAVLSQDFDNLNSEDPPDLPGGLTPEQRAYVLRHAGMIKGWLDALHDSALTDALAGRSTPGQKAVYSRAGNRRWTDTAAVEKFLLSNMSREKALVTKLLSPAQAEKVIGKKRADEVNKLTIRRDPKPILVLANDARPAIEPLIKEFADLDGDELI